MPKPTDHAHSILKANEWLALQPVYLDTETTGINKTDEIVDIAIIANDGAVLVDTLVRPTAPISSVASAVHHITDAMVQTAPTWPELWPQVQAALAGRTVVIFNADFDVRLLQQTHARHQMPWALQANFVCLMKLYAQFKGDKTPRGRSYRWHSLESAGAHCGIELPNAHRAKADSLLARAVLHHMAKAQS